MWAATGNPTAENEAFNCTNGDAFRWGSLWEVVAGEFGVRHVARGGEGLEWVARMRGKRNVWDLIVEDGDLVRTGLDEIRLGGRFYSGADEIRRFEVFGGAFLRSLWHKLP